MKAVTFLMVIPALTLASASDLSAETRGAKVESAPRLESAVVVRTYNYAAVSAERLGAARLEAEQIFTRAGIVLRWIDCHVPGGDGGAACT